MNISRSETQHQIAGINNIPNVTMDRFSSRLIGHVAMAMGDHLINNGLSAHARDGSFARGINVGDDHPICVIEGGPELSPQSLGARVAMRLKHREHALPSG